MSCTVAVVGRHVCLNDLGSSARQVEVYTGLIFSEEPDGAGQNKSDMLCVFMQVQNNYKYQTDSQHGENTRRKQFLQIKSVCLLTNVS